MGKLLEKALKDAVKEDKCTLGARQVLGSIPGSKLVVLSQSVRDDAAQGIEQAARDAGVATVRFDGSSVALGKLCGLQFRVSAASVTSMAETGIQSILNENEKE